MRTASRQNEPPASASGAPVQPLLYELNTRCRLRDLSQRQGKPVTLASIPATEFTHWQELGFTHIWLMGVWTTGPRSRQEALNNVTLAGHYRELLGGETTDDLLASPYAIADYAVPPALGGNAGLRKFRQRLHAHGLKLILDFVPNHVGLDHPWVTGRPELFVNSAEEFPEAFQIATAHGPRWIAHGKDPNFPAWADTAQLDHRRAATRDALLGVLASIAELCDGVRCDLAMLSLHDVFARTWEKVPAQDADAEGEFWCDAIAETRLARREFLFLGEVYWGLEARLQSLGFDFTYDKHLSDLLLHRRHADVQPYLLSRGGEFHARCAHFLENHDEARVADQLSLEEHRAAALLTLGLPGMRLLQEGQLAGARHRLPVFFGRRPAEPVNPLILSMYEQLLAALKSSAVSRGRAELLTPVPAWSANVTHTDFTIVQWQAEPPEFDLVVVNYSPHSSQCHVHPNVEHLASHDWQMRDLLGDEHYLRRGGELATRGLYLDVKPFGAQLFRFQPDGYSESYLVQHAAKF